MTRTVTWKREGAYEKEINEIRAIFEKAADYGSEEHAISSIISLYLQYMASLFQTGKTLSELLDTASKSQEKAPAQNQETEPEKKVPLNSGTLVFVLLSSVESGTAFGSFEHDNVACQIKIPLKGKKIVDAMKKAHKQKKTVNVLITGYTNGLYLGRKR